MSKCIRFANIIHFTHLSNEEMWNVLKSIRSTTSYEKDCYHDGMNEENDKLQQVSIVEHVLKMQPNENIFEILTNNDLKTAAEMFMYLNTCPKLIKPWFVFYNDLFENRSPNQIILTLNRIMKVIPTPQNKYFIDIAKDLFVKSTTVFSFKYKEIQNITKNAGNFSVLGNPKKEGLIVYLNILYYV